MKFHRNILFVIVFVAVCTACSIGQPEPTVEPFPTTSHKIELPTSSISTPHPFSGLGMQVEPLESGGTQAINYDLRYQITFDSFWTVISNTDELEEYLFTTVNEKIGDDFPNLVEAASNQAGVQLIAYMVEDQSLGINENNSTYFMVVEQDVSTVQLMDTDIILQANLDILPTLVPDVVLSDSGVRTNIHGIEYGYFLATYPENIYGYPAKQAVVLIKLGSDLVALTCGTHENKFSDVERFCQMVIDSFEIVN